MDFNSQIVIADQALDCHIESGNHDEGNKINCCRVMIVVLNATFNNIPAMSWRSVLLMEENQSSWKKQPACHKSLTKFIA